MQSGSNENITLAIETAVLGGSLSLLRDGEEIDHWIGGEGVSRSEDLLLSIADILRKNSIDRSGLTSIAVSMGPGSYTGIRVGMSTALGLKNALNISCKSIQVLRAMCLAKTSADVEAVAAIPLGRDEICWQLYGPGGAGELMAGGEEQFRGFIADHAPTQMVLHEKIFDRVAGSMNGDNVGAENVGADLARYIGLAAQSEPDGGDFVPIYIRDFL